MKTVVVGLSGGVDSSVAAFLLKEKKYRVIGLFMKNWHDTAVTISEECPWMDDSQDALLVAQRLNIPFQTVDLSETYKERIVDYMFSEYRSGRTPNPDVLCNREIKFDLFLKEAEKLGADFIATGHYCQKTTSSNGTDHLLAGNDPEKDQSYFLCQLNSFQLSKTLFPIGHLHKSEVRKIAAEQGLVTAEKKDSQGLCFIGKVKLPVFLRQQLSPKTGDVIELPDTLPLLTHYHEKTTDDDYKKGAAPFGFRPEQGKVIGHHQGAYYVTIGQRKGLKIGGTRLPLFVVETDTERNIIYVGQGDRHPALYRKALFIPSADVHWVHGDWRIEVGEKKEYAVRVRYRQPLEAALLFCEPEGVYIAFRRPIRGIAPGQFAAWYEGNELIGSGRIAS